MSDQSYHPNNLNLQPYPHDAVIELADRALALGVQFKINGLPFGAAYDRDLWEAFSNDFFRGPAETALET